MQAGRETPVLEPPLSHSADPERGRPAKAYSAHVSEVTGIIEARIAQIEPYMDPELPAELRGFLPAAGQFHDPAEGAAALAACPGDSGRCRLHQRGP